MKCHTICEILTLMFTPLHHRQKNPLSIVGLENTPLQVLARIATTTCQQKIQTRNSIYKSGLSLFLKKA